MQWLAGVVIFALAAVLAGGRVPAGEPLPGLVPLDDQALAALAGGFHAGGLDIDIGIDVRTRFADHGAAGPAGPADYETRLTLPAGGGAMALSTAGRPLTGAEVARASLATRIDNSADNRSIEHAVRLDVVVTRMAAVTRQMAVARAMPGGGSRGGGTAAPFR